MTGNVMADFSSRGPYLVEPNWLKPDVAAPGVRVLAGATPEPSDGSPGAYFQYLSGTSMAAPHVAGVAALLIGEHPEWTPAIVKSALMTTAGRRILKEDAFTRADPFDQGSGMIKPSDALDPGLAFTSFLPDYLAASCGTATPLIPPDECQSLADDGYSLDPSDLNLPSIAVNGLSGSKTVKRTVRAIAPDQRAMSSMSRRRRASGSRSARPA